MKEKLNRHESMRGWFAYDLHGQMKKNGDIWVVTGDLGYGMFDRIRDDYPNRFVNVGAAEQGGVGASVGLALKEKIPVFYSITPFALYRPFEWIRNYMDNEQIPVKIVGGGRDKDYKHDGFTHWSEEAFSIMNNLSGIEQYWPEQKEDVPVMLGEMLNNNKPSFMSLRR